MILNHKYLEIDPAGLKCKEFWENRFYGELLVFSTASVHENGDFSSVYSVPGTNAGGSGL